MRSARYAFLLVPVLIASRADAAPAQGAAADSSLAAPAAVAGAPLAAGAARPAWRTLASGDRVRIVSAAGRYAGTVTRVTSDSVMVAAAGRQDAILRSDVSRLERFAGKSSRQRSILTGGGAGMVSGAVLGGVAGRLVGRIHCRPDDELCTPGQHDATIQGALLGEGALLGAIVGAMLGPTFRREHWERAEAAFPLEAAPAPNGGIAAGVTLRF